ncbi:unnamed protein product [Arabis nemorensis]|uniref:Exonuclease domain-containing protein n=1 Tax=Arabis nemorensis TaxID=586526 RepID=A0A565ASF8_9BRAS|nr:unnamed protein product [Arabis nemorensis]
MSYHILFFGMEYAENEEIVEYGALKVSTHSLTTIEEYHSFIQPSLQTINNFKERTRLTRENLTRAYTFSTIHLSLFELLNDQIWIGYNIDSIHYPRLKKACEYQNLLCPIPRQTIDTRLLWTLDFEEGKDVSLQSLGNHFGIEEQEQHLSIPDCHLNLKVFIRCGGRHILNEFMKEGV